MSDPPSTVTVAASISTFELKSLSVALLWNNDDVLLTNTLELASTFGPVKCTFD